MTESTDALARRVGSLNRDLAATLREHEEFYKELLPHVFFGEVSPWAVDRAASAELEPLLTLLEDAYRTGDQDVRDLIGASFIENVEDNPTIVDRLGPNLRAAANPW